MKITKAITHYVNFRDKVLISQVLEWEFPTPEAERFLSGQNVVMERPQPLQAILFLPIGTFP